MVLALSVSQSGPPLHSYPNLLPCYPLSTHRRQGKVTPEMLAIPKGQFLFIGACEALAQGRLLGLCCLLIPVGLSSWPS
jgi:hypothetical protein